MILITVVFYDMEEKDGIVQAGSCLCSFPQHATIGYVESMGDQPVRVLPVVITQLTVTIKASL